MSSEVFSILALFFLRLKKIQANCKYVRQIILTLKKEKRVILKMFVVVLSPSYTEKIPQKMSFKLVRSEILTNFNIILVLKDGF